MKAQIEFQQIKIRNSRQREYDTPGLRGVRQFCEQELRATAQEWQAPAEETQERKQKEGVQACAQGEVPKPLHGSPGFSTSLTRKPSH